MGRRYLSLALLTEGASDQWFLVPLIDRQIAELALGAPVGFDYSGVVAGERFTVAHRDLVAEEVAELLGYFDIVVIHHDHNERHKADAIRERFPDDAHRIVALVPVRETEAWMLADPEALREAAPTRDAAWEVPYDVEKVADPKAVLKAALGGRRDAERDFGRLGQTVALDALGKVPAYRRWTAELRRAMEGLRLL
ncbi:DUF4276 family protein [Streptomyces capillispiralis]|uniref:Uncharacterized protein DUF4276 n=1 Tax=Streptomyces capillispiralis TaxID=68182 RepID=A0A561TLE9_9ACTN|nr:DUF4276 family protein [Streptomyces capillispiralis]TWF87979.1 uncharacterized protein DUF4276 [Streptomyces capillispiralis]GHH94928.1 hypothetical protein GCM10017779_53850 [Streptomyces capillispiralis]